MRFACGALLLAAVAACSVISPDDDNDPDLCPQTEFGNYGCARVEGRVLSAAGEPVSGAFVALLAAGEDRGEYNVPVEKTGADGRFKLEVRRVYQPPQTPTVSDTATMKLRADLAVAGEGMVTDSVPVVMHFSPVGAPAIVVQRDIQLP